MFYNVVFPGNSFVGILVIDPARAYTVVVRTCESPHGKGEDYETLDMYFIDIYFGYVWNLGIFRRILYR